MRLAIYARVSTEEQKEGQTIDSQIAELERFAADRAWPLAGVYKDEGWSGALLARPELDRLRDDATKGMFNAVLINDVDRLARDVTHLGIVKRDLERKGVQVLFRKLPAESSPTQNLMINILGSFAEFERELIADRTRRGRLHKIEGRQQYLGGNTAYGYRYVPMGETASGQGRLEVLPEEAAVVRQMFAWVDREGLSARQIQHRLDERAIPPRKGRRTWAKSSVLRILHNEMYAGVWHYNKSQAVPGPSEPVRAVKAYRRHLNSGKKPRRRAEWIALRLPKALCIIDHQQWQRVQAQLQRNIAFSPRHEKHAYLLKSLVHCGGCGARFVGEPGKGAFYYRCLNRCKRCPSIREETLNDTVWAAVKDALMNPDLIADQVGRRFEEQAAQAQADKLAAHTAEQALGQITTEEARLIEAYRLSVISAAQLGAELEKLNARRGVLVASSNDNHEPTTSPSPNQARMSIASYCAAIAAQLHTLEHTEIRQLLRLLVRRIVFFGSHVKIQAEIPGASTAGPFSAHAPSAPEDGIVATTADRHVRNVGRDNLEETTTAHGACGQPGYQFHVEATVVRDRSKVDAAWRANLLKARAKLKQLYARGWSPWHPHMNTPDRAANSCMQQSAVLLPLLSAAPACLSLPAPGAMKQTTTTHELNKPPWTTSSRPPFADLNGVQ